LRSAQQQTTKITAQGAKVLQLFCAAAHMKNIVPSLHFCSLLFSSGKYPGRKGAKISGSTSVLGWRLSKRKSSNWFFFFLKITIIADSV
jgi:hypothetical protein